MTKNAQQVEVMAVIGLGLIGGSIAKSSYLSGFANHTIGYSLNFSEARLGVELGVVHEAAQTIEQAVSNADLIIIAVPVRAFESILFKVKPFLKKGAVITDVGSVKGCFLEAVRNVFNELPSFVVPGHPIAGSEKNGVLAANENLFKNHKVILTPHEYSAEYPLQLVRNMWQAAGSTVLEMSVAHHDEVLAATSHLPHLIAFSLVDTLAGEEDSQEIFRYAAGGFRDFTIKTVSACWVYLREQKLHESTLLKFYLDSHIQIS